VVGEAVVTLVDVINGVLAENPHLCMDNDEERGRLTLLIAEAIRNTPEAQIVRIAQGDEPIAYTIRIVGANGRDQQKYHLAARWLADPPIF